MTYTPKVFVPLNISYDDAVFLRKVAEEGRDPNLFKDAAKAFRYLGLYHAADRCYDRAQYYEKEENTH